MKQPCCDDFTNGLECGCFLDEALEEYNPFKKGDKVVIDIPSSVNHGRIATIQYEYPEPYMPMSYIVRFLDEDKDYKYSSWSLKSISDD